MAEPRRLGKNAGGYFGERIDVRAVLREIESLAAARGWAIERLQATPAVELLALRRGSSTAARHIYVSAGIHGDEPAGPLAMRQLLEEDRWPADADLRLCPCLNPAGFERNTRESGDGVDLNRDYRHLVSPEVRAHVAWLQRQPRFDFTLCLHEDWEAHGFYCYELNTVGRVVLGSRIVEAAGKVCPIDHSPHIDGWEARAGVILAEADPTKREKWAEAFYLFVNQTAQTCTLEAPSDFPLAARVAALVAGVHAALANAEGGMSGDF